MPERVVAALLVVMCLALWPVFDYRYFDTVNAVTTVHSTSSEVCAAAGTVAAERVVDIFSSRLSFCHAQVGRPLWMSSAPHLKAMTPAECAVAVARVPTKRDGNSDVQQNALQCIGGISTWYHLNESGMITIWHNRRGGLSPWLNVLHGGPSPRVMFKQGGVVLFLLGLHHQFFLLELSANLNASSAHYSVERQQLTPKTVLVELGSGNGQLLFSMCPVDPSLSILCAGVDITPTLVDHARSYVTHAILDAGTRMASLPNGSATHVFSHGVVGLLQSRVCCLHVLEGLRLLSTGGVFLLMMLAQDHRSWPTRIHPFFFNSSAVNATRGGDVLEYCSATIGVNFSRLVAKVEFLFEVPGEFLFVAKQHRRVFITRLWRSSQPMSESTTGGNNSQTGIPLAAAPAFVRDIINATQAKTETKHVRSLIRDAFSKRHERIMEMWTWKRPPKSGKKQKIVDDADDLL